MLKSSKKLDAVKAVSVAIDLSEKMGRKLRVDAAFNGLSPQDQLRKLIDLPYKKPQRPRITLSLRDEDYAHLATRYDIDEANKGAIKKAVMAEIAGILQIKD